MTFPIRFLLPDRGYRRVSVEGEGFPAGIDLSLTYNEKALCWAATIPLPRGIYRYHFKADRFPVPCPFRASGKNEASLVLGVDEILFSPQNIFIRNNAIVLAISIETSYWQEIRLNLQSPFGTLQNIEGLPLFYEGTRCYYGFFISDAPADTLLGYFELKSGERMGFFGTQGFTDKEWAVAPFELDKSKLDLRPVPNIKAVYRFSSPKDVREFEKRSEYFDNFTPSHIDAPLSYDSRLRKKLRIICPGCLQNFSLPFLVRDIFLEPNDINPALSLLGRYNFEHMKEAPYTRIRLSDDEVSFWDLSRRNLPSMLRAAAFQLLCTHIPDVLFGEEIGLSKTGESRHMYWTKAKWNKDIYNFYETMFNLREEYPIFRTGHTRFIMQDCAIWGIERFIEGQESVFIFANHSKDNVVIDLTKIIGQGLAIKELLTNHILKRKRICTIFAESVSVYMVVNNPVPDEEESEE